MSCFSSSGEESVSFTQSSISSSLCSSPDLFDQCIPDYQGPMRIKSKWLKLWQSCNCRISGTKIYFSNNTTFLLTPAHHIIKFVEEVNLFGLIRLNDEYIIHIADGSRIVLSMKINNEADWDSWVLHLNLALSLSIRLQPASLLYSTNNVDFDGYFHRNATEIMLQSFAIFELIQSREKYRDLQRLGSIYQPNSLTGSQELKLRKAYELQCAKILVEILHLLVSASPNDFSQYITEIEAFHEYLSGSELANSNLLTSYIDDYCYQRIRQYMVSNLKTLGSVRSVCHDQANRDNHVVSPISLPQSFKVVTTLTFASVYMYNISLLVNNPSDCSSFGFLNPHRDNMYTISRDMQFRNGDLMSCVVGSYNDRLSSNALIYVKFFRNILLKRYPTCIDACSDILSNTIVSQRYFRGWGALITTARSGDVDLFQYMLHHFISINPPKQWVNWKELLVNACGCNQSIPLIQLIINHYQTQRPIAPAEILVLLVSSIDTKLEVLMHFYRMYDMDPYSLDMSICIDNGGFVHPSSTYYASMRRFYRALPAFLDRQTLLHVAAAGNRIDLVKLVHSWLPRQVSVVDVRGFLPLHIACCLSCSLEVVQYLYETYPESIHYESSSVSDVFWPDIRFRNSLPIHLAASVCLSPSILKFLFQKHLEQLPGYASTASTVDAQGQVAITSLLKKCVENCIIHSNQSFTAARLDCLKFLLRMMSIYNPQGSLSLDFLDPGSSHFSYLPQYEYMPGKVLNEQVGRIILRLPQPVVLSPGPIEPIPTYRDLNWKARRGAMLLYQRRHVDLPIEDEQPSQNQPLVNSHNSSVWTWVSIPRSRSRDSGMNSSNHISDLDISSRKYVWSDEAIRGVWENVVTLNDVFRHCVSYL